MSLLSVVHFRWRLIIIFIMLLLFRNSGAAQYVYADGIIFVANASVPVDSLTHTEIKNIYMGKIKLWENGDKIILAYSSKESSQKLFLKKYLKKTPSQFVNYWRNLMFTGKASSIPKGITDEDELIKYIATQKGAIGYVSSVEQTDGIKTISVK